MYFSLLSGHTGPSFRLQFACSFQFSALGNLNSLVSSFYEQLFPWYASYCEPILLNFSGILEHSDAATLIIRWKEGDAACG